MKLCLALLLASVLTASAHPLLQNAMWVVFAPDRVRVATNVTLREIMVAQQVGAETDAALSAAAEKHADYVLRHLALRVGTQELVGRIEKITPPVLFGGEPEQTFYQYQLDYPLPSGALPASVNFAHTMLKEWPYSPGQPWDVTYLVRLKRSDRPEVDTGLLRAQSPQDFQTGWSSAEASHTAHPFGAYFQHGVMHILTGWDHLLFVTALVLATATFWEMFKVIAAFTLAHTITLAVSVLTGFRLPDSFVEPVIAGSIIFVALENILWPRRSHGWLRLGVAFGFGLVHGLGFAGGLRDAMGELGTSAVVLALLAFSLGVEVGHQVVVLPTFGLLRVGAWKCSETFRSGVLRYGSIAISVAGAYYFVHALTA